jgi:RsiW-degrading membrane proteinase PrsW (M82 family)
VLLASLLSASLSTALALLLEGIALVGTMAVILATLRFTEDQSALALITRAAEDPQTLARLEEAIIHSPTALIGLGFILVFVAPAIEELVKALPLLVFARHRPQIGERTAILIGVAGGIGFAFAENVGYLGMLSDEWALFFWFRAAAAVMHGAASGFVGRAWHRGLRGQWGRMLVDLCTGWGIHGGWNALALVVGWFSYREVTAGILFTIGFGLMPLALLFTVMAWWGIWVSRKA